MSQEISEAQWLQYYRDGYLQLGKLLEDDELKALQDRIDSIMLGEADLDYDRMLMQLDSSSGEYGEAGEQSRGFKGATLNYRKIQDLEYDPLFLEFMQRPIFREICERVYGGHTDTSCFRAMFMNKPSGAGTFLPWHQDRWTMLDRDPLITLWTALDPATKENGCVQIIKGSHIRGVINPSHGSAFLTEEQAEKFAPESERIFLELEAGGVTLLHNWLLHSSDKNHADVSRRAFSVCYMDARTKNQSGAQEGTIIFGENALDPDELRRERNPISA